MRTARVQRDGKEYEVDFRDGAAVTVWLHSRSSLYDPHVRTVWAATSGKPASARTEAIIRAALAQAAG